MCVCVCVCVFLCVYVYMNTHRSTDSWRLLVCVFFFSYEHTQVNGLMAVACVCVFFFLMNTHRSTDSWRLLHRLTGHAGSVLALAVRGALLVSSSDDLTIRLWDPKREWKVLFFIFIFFLP